MSADGDREDRTPLARLLIQHRRARDLSQEQLAEAAGVSAGYIGFIEKGRRRPSRETLARITDALDLTARQRADVLALLPEEQPSLLDRVARLEAAVELLLDRLPGRRLQ